MEVKVTLAVRRQSTLPEESKSSSDSEMPSFDGEFPFNNKSSDSKSGPY